MQTTSIAKSRSWLIAAGIIGVIVVWLWTGSGADEDEAPTVAAETSGAARDFSVRVRNQVAEEVTRVVKVNGSTAPARRVDINAETDGRVVEIGVDRGERVSRGGIIVRLDARDREARLTQARAVLKQREVEFAARDRLKAQSYVSEAQLQEAAALLETARAELRRAELDIDYMLIRAPFDGALQDRTVEVGDFVGAGDPVATFVDDRTIIVTAAVSEFDANQVERGEEASAVLATGETVDGIVRYVAPVADDATRTFRVELEVDNGDGKLRSGVSAELLIPGDKVFAHKVAPSILTLDGDGNVGVKVLNEEGIVEFYEADIATSSADAVYVTGLPSAVNIITVGQGFVNVGSYVTGVPEGDVDRAVAIKSEERAQR